MRRLNQVAEARMLIVGSPSWVQSVFSGVILILATAGARFLGRRQKA